MRIIIVALGTLGDVAPCIALGQGFVAAGDEVKILTFSRFESHVRQYGLEFCAVNCQLETFLERDLTQFHLTISTVMRAIRQMPQTALEIQHRLEDLMQDCLDAFVDVDLVLGQAIGHLAAWPIAQQLNLPYCALYYAPLTRTRAFPNAFSGDIFPSRPGWYMWGKESYNWWTHTASKRIFWSRMHPLIRKSLHATLKQPAISLDPHFPILYGYSPTILPKPREWKSHITVTGYWQLKQPEGWQPSADLTAFLEAGPVPIYIGFGSISGQNTKKVIQLATQALKVLNLRCILQADSREWPELRACENIFFLQSAPHAWLFPRMTAVMHHGGAGTTAAALRAGIPQIIVPFIADQSFWGHLIAISGVGPAPLQHKTMRLIHVQNAIAETVTDAHMRLRALALSELICAENGVDHAVEIVHAFMQTQSMNAGTFPLSKREEVRRDLA